MIITYKYRMYQARRNKDLHEIATLAGRAYNHCVALHKRYYKLTGKHINQYELMRHLARLKKRPRFSWLRAIPSQALQNIAERIERGYQLFFKSIKNKPGVKTSPPTFKKSREYKSFTLKQTGYKFLESSPGGPGRIRIGAKVFKYVKDREIVGAVKTVTVKRDKLSNFYLYVAQEVEEPEFKPTTGKMAGFDFGLKTFLTVHDGVDTYPIESPLFFKEALTDLRMANRNLAHKIKGSNRHSEAKRTLVKVHEKITNRRQDWFFKLANTLTDRYDVLFFETLNLDGMKRMWGRKVSDLSFGTFLTILEHMARKKGKQVHCVDRFFPSSKTCSHCGHVHHDLKLSDRIWRCPACSLVVDRDGNAAANILREGASSLGRASVSPHSRQPALTPETCGP